MRLRHITGGQSRDYTRSRFPNATKNKERRRRSIDPPAPLLISESLRLCASEPLRL